MQDDLFNLKKDESLLNANLLQNDGLPDQYQFTTTNLPSNEGIVVAPDGTFSYSGSNESRSLNFSYLVCDPLCAEFCDSAKVVINVDCLLNADNVIPNGFDPYRGEKFDPLSYLINPNCDEVVLLEESSLQIFDSNGRLVFKTQPYEAWGGKASKQETFSPVDNYFWILELQTQNSDIKSQKTRSGSILLFHN